MSDDLLKQLKAVFGDSEVKIYAIDEDGIHQVSGPTEAADLHSPYGDYPHGWELVDDDGRLVRYGELITSGRGDEYELVGGAAPHKSSSAGRVYVIEDEQDSKDFPQSYFPHVFNLHWRRYNES